MTTPTTQSRKIGRLRWGMGAEVRPWCVHWFKDHCGTISHYCRTIGPLVPTTWACYMCLCSQWHFLLTNTSGIISSCHSFSSLGQTCPLTSSIRIAHEWVARPFPLTDRNPCLRNTQAIQTTVGGAHTVTRAQLERASACQLFISFTELIDRQTLHHIDAFTT